MTDGPPRPAAFRRFIFTVLVAIVLAGAAGVLHHDAKADDDDAVKAPQRVSIEHGETVITLDAEAQQSSGIRLVTLHNTMHPQRLHAYATVLDVEPLTALRSRYAEAKGRLLAAKAKLAASKDAFERARKLYADRQNVSAGELQTTEAAYRVDEADVDATQSRLRMLSAAAQQAWGPILGGAAVHAAPLLDRLIARKDLLLEVTLPPDSPLARPAPGAFVPLHGETRAPIALVSPATRTDPHIQGVSFFYTSAAQPGLLPGMRLLAYLPSGKSVEGAVVPAAAIVWVQGRASIYLRTGAKTFARRAIPTDVPAPGGGYVVQGLPDGAQVVVQGAQMLLSEAFRAPAQGGDDD